jgi:hypothetical protein
LQFSDFCFVALFTMLFVDAALPFLASGIPEDNSVGGCR